MAFLPVCRACATERLRVCASLEVLSDAPACKLMCAKAGPIHCDVPPVVEGTCASGLDLASSRRVRAPSSARSLCDAAHQVRDHVASALRGRPALRYGGCL